MFKSEFPRLRASADAPRACAAPMLSVPHGQRDALLLAALAARGLNPDALPVTGNDGIQGNEHQTEKDGMLPGVYVSEYVIELRWDLDGTEILFEMAMMGEDEWSLTLTVEEQTFPEAVLNGCVGEPLSRIVGLEGADAFVITSCTGGKQHARFELRRN